MARILFVGGGSVGHIAPAVAIWRACEESHPDAEAHFICADREGDRTFLQGEGLPFSTIKAPRLSIGMPWKLLRSFRQSLAVFKQWKPHVVLSKGGYVSVPVCMAARWMEIPVVLHESDAVSGRANRFVALFARKICLGFPPKSGVLPANAIVTGNPVRPQMLRGGRERGLQLTGLSGERPILLVIGGSQGSQAINDALLRALPFIKSHTDVVHITGEGKGEPCSEAHYWARPFANAELADLYAIADIAVSRAGASGFAELAGNGIPTILVPLRGVGHDHQQQNAETIAAKGACVLLAQENMQRDMPKIVLDLLSHTEKRNELATRARAFAHPHAAMEIATALWEQIAN